MSKLPILRIAIHLVTALGTLTGAARAWVLEGQRWPTTPGATSTVYIATCLGSTQWKLPYPTRIPFVDRSTAWNAVFMAAAADWNQYIETLQLYPYRATARYGGHFGDHVNEARFSATSNGDQLGGETLALTTYYYDTMTNFIIESDIVFNTGIIWNSYRGPLRGVVDIRRVALHELGHLLGLDHPDQAGQLVNAIMNSTVSNTDDLTPDDIAGARHLYGAR